MIWGLDLVYPRQELEARKAILEALLDHTSVENGIGYNMLFDIVSKQIHSKATFHKYLDKLIHEGYVTKVADPAHGIGVLIYRLKEASDAELLRLKLLEDIFGLRLKKASQFEMLVHKILEYTYGPTIVEMVKQIEYDKEKLGILKAESMRNARVIANSIFSAHQALIKVFPKITGLYGSAPYIQATEEDGRIRLQFKPVSE